MNTHREHDCPVCQGTGKVPTDVATNCERIDVIKAAVATEFNVTLKELGSRKRTERVAWPRQIVYWLSHQFTTAGYSEMGRHFKRDHGAVMYGIQQVENRMSTEPLVKHKITRLRSDLELVLPPLQPKQSL